MAMAIVHEDEHHFRVSKLIEKGHVVQEEICQNTSSPSGKQDRYHGNDSQRPPQPITTDHQKNEEKRT